MVAKKVEISSLSHQEGSVGAHWTCDGSTSYELAEIEKTTGVRKLSFPWKRMNLNSSNPYASVEF
jgi:hypothetical protein